MSAAWQALLFLAGGTGLGTLHFVSLARNAALYVEGTGGGGKRWRAVALHAARLAVTAGVLVLAARAGALPLLAATLGFLAARALVMRRLGGAR